MKKIMVPLAALIVLVAGLSAFAQLRIQKRMPFGGGRMVTLSNDVAQVVTFNDSSILDTGTNYQAYAREVSLYNASGGTVYYMSNITTANLATAVAAGVAVPIPNTVTHSITRDKEDPIYSVAIRFAASGATGIVWVAAN